MADSFDTETIAKIRALLTHVDELWLRRAHALTGSVDPGSLVASDYPLPNARLVIIYAAQSSSAAIDHLNAWRLIANGPVIPIAAHLTLMRAALESAVRCRWYVDPIVSSGTRVGRGIAGRRADQIERSKFEASREAGPRPGAPVSGKTALQRLDELDHPDAIAERDIAGVERVGYTDTTSLMVACGYERWCRLVSGLSHSREWALAATRVEARGDSPTEEKTRRGRTTASAPIALALTIETLRAVRTAVDDLARYRHGEAKPTP